MEQKDNIFDANELEDIQYSGYGQYDYMIQYQIDRKLDYANPEIITQKLENFYETLVFDEIKVETGYQS